MRGYDRIDEDLDEYEEDGIDGYEDVEGDEYEEVEEEVEEDPARKREISEYLVLREKLKEKARKKLEKESLSAEKNSLGSTKTLPLKNFGSFFGPSQPVIADRVIQESKTFLEARHLAPHSTHQSDRKKSITSEPSRPKSSGSANLPRNPVKAKVQTLKDTRDYSFLSNDAEDPRQGNRKMDLGQGNRKMDPGQVKNPTQRNNSDTRAAQVPDRSKAPGSHPVRPALNGHREKTSGPGNHGIQGANGHSVKKLSSGGKLYSTTPSSDRRLHHERLLEPGRRMPTANGSGTGRPVMSKDMPSRKSFPPMERRAPVDTEKKSFSSLPKKAPVSSLDRKASVVGGKPTVPGGQRPLARPQAPVTKQHVEQRRDSQGSVKQKMLPPKSVSSSKPQMVNTAKQVPSRTNLSDDHHKRKPMPSKKRSYEDDEDAKALAMIRNMFGYNPSKYVDDDDTSDMEADFRTIQLEERRSAKIAREEDEREQRLIEEEERRERMRKEGKRRKLSH